MMMTITHNPNQGNDMKVMTLSVSEGFIFNRRLAKRLADTITRFAPDAVWMIGLEHPNRAVARICKAAGVSLKVVVPKWSGSDDAYRTTAGDCFRDGRVNHFVALPDGRNTVFNCALKFSKLRIFDLRNAHKAPPPPPTVNPWTTSRELRAIRIGMGKSGPVYKIVRETAEVVHPATSDETATWDLQAKLDIDRDGPVPEEHDNGDRRMRPAPFDPQDFR